MNISKMREKGGSKGGKRVITLRNETKLEVNHRRMNGEDRKRENGGKRQEETMLE